MPFPPPFIFSISIKNEFPNRKRMCTNTVWGWSGAHFYRRDASLYICVVKLGEDKVNLVHTMANLLFWNVQFWAVFNVHLIFYNLCPSLPYCGELLQASRCLSQAATPTQNITTVTTASLHRVLCQTLYNRTSEVAHKGRAGSFIFALFDCCIEVW